MSEVASLAATTGTTYEPSRPGGWCAWGDRPREDSWNKGIGNSLKSCQMYCNAEISCNYFNFKPSDGLCELGESCVGEVHIPDGHAYRKVVDRAENIHGSEEERR